MLTIPVPLHLHHHIIPQHLEATHMHPLVLLLIPALVKLHFLTQIHTAALLKQHLDILIVIAMILFRPPIVTHKIIIQVAAVVVMKLGLIEDQHGLMPQLVEVIIMLEILAVVLGLVDDLVRTQ